MACDEVDADGSCVTEDDVSNPNWATVAAGLLDKASEIQDNFGLDLFEAGFEAGIVAGATLAGKYAAGGAAACSPGGPLPAAACAVGGAIIGFVGGVVVSNVTTMIVEQDAYVYTDAANLILNNTSANGELNMTITISPEHNVPSYTGFRVPSTVRIPETIFLTGADRQTVAMTPSQFEFLNSLINQ
jgi:hypothetical protein